MSRVIDLWHTLALAMSGYHMSEKLKFSRRLQNKTQINKGSILLSTYIHKDVNIIAETHYLRWISVFMAFGLREFLICHKSSVFRSHLRTIYNCHVFDMQKALETYLRGRLCITFQWLNQILSSRPQNNDE